MGFDRKFAVRYSFLMSIPAILGANILSLKDAVSAGIIWADVRSIWWVWSWLPVWDMPASDC